MKKLVFAVIAAVAMVSVSNVFAGNRMVKRCRFRTSRHSSSSRHNSNTC